MQYDYDQPRKVKATTVYWFDDEPTKGGCRVPLAWRLLYKAKPGDEWKEVPNPSAYGLEKDKFNRVTFDAIEAAAVRLEVQLREGLSGGILRWHVE